MSCKQKISKFLLRALGWRGVDGKIPDKKSIVLGVPHTSIMDFVIAWLYYASVGGEINILIKKEFFVWPLGPILKWLGAIPVDRSGGATQCALHCIDILKNSDSICLGIAPEGTRKLTKNWKTGFYTFAKAANVPLYLGHINWKTKEVGRGEKFQIGDDVKEDLKKIQAHYKAMNLYGRYPGHYWCGD